MGWFFPIFFLLLVVAVITATVYQQVKAMSSPEKMLLSKGAQLEELLPEVDPKFLQWINANHWQYIGAYKFGQIDFLAWSNQEKTTTVLYYLVPGGTAFIDLSTHLGPDAGLVTTNSKDAHTFPKKPGASFSEGLDLKEVEALERAHEKSLMVLKETRNFSPEPQTEDFIPYLLNSIREEMEYVQTLTLWPIRGVWWFFVRKRRYWNKTIEEQIRRGMC